MHQLPNRSPSSGLVPHIPCVPRSRGRNIRRNLRLPSLTPSKGCKSPLEQNPALHHHQCNLGPCWVSNFIAYNSLLFSRRSIPTVSLVVGTHLQALGVALCWAGLLAIAGLHHIPLFAPQPSPLIPTLHWRFCEWLAVIMSVLPSTTSLECTLPEDSDLSILIMALAPPSEICLAHSRCSVMIGEQKERREREKLVGFYSRDFWTLF